MRKKRNKIPRENVVHQGKTERSGAMKAADEENEREKTRTGKKEHQKNLKRREGGHWGINYYLQSQDRETETKSTGQENGYANGKKKQAEEGETCGKEEVAPERTKDREAEGRGKKIGEIGGEKNNGGKKQKRSSKSTTWCRGKGLVGKGIEAYACLEGDGGKTRGVKKNLRQVPRGKTARRAEQRRKT